MKLGVQGGILFKVASISQHMLKNHIKNALRV